MPGIIEIGMTEQGQLTAVENPLSYGSPNQFMGDVPTYLGDYATMDATDWIYNWSGSGTTLESRINLSSASLPAAGVLIDANVCVNVKRGICFTPPCSTPDVTIGFAYAGGGCNYGGPVTLTDSWLKRCRTDAPISHSVSGLAAQLCIRQATGSNASHGVYADQAGVIYEYTITPTFTSDFDLSGQNILVDFAVTNCQGVGTYLTESQDGAGAWTQVPGTGTACPNFTDKSFTPSGVLRIRTTHTADGRAIASAIATSPWKAKPTFCGVCGVSGQHRKYCGTVSTATEYLLQYLDGSNWVGDTTAGSPCFLGTPVTPRDYRMASSSGGVPNGPFSGTFSSVGAPGCGGMSCP